MKLLIKNARIKKSLTHRELAQLMGIDQALISKFESGTRKPTKPQLVQLSAILQLDLHELKVQWLKEKVLYEIGDDALAHAAQNDFCPAFAASLLERLVGARLQPQLSLHHNLGRASF
jgi:transcriptional regulator with XRE-family HTH domain